MQLNGCGMRQRLFRDADDSRVQNGAVRIWRMCDQVARATSFTTAEFIAAFGAVAQMVFHFAIDCLQGIAVERCIKHHAAIPLKKLSV